MENKEKENKDKKQTQAEKTAERVRVKNSGGMFGSPKIAGSGNMFNR